MLGKQHMLKQTPHPFDHHLRMFDQADQYHLQLLFLNMLNMTLHDKNMVTAASKMNLSSGQSIVTSKFSASAKSLTL